MLQDTITIDRCHKCGMETEWDSEFEPQPICWSCLCGVQYYTDNSRWLVEKAKRNEAMAALYATGDKTREQLAKLYKLSERSVCRILKGGEGNDKGIERR